MRTFVQFVACIVCGSETDKNFTPLRLRDSFVNSTLCISRFKIIFLHTDRRRGTSCSARSAHSRVERIAVYIIHTDGRRTNVKLWQWPNDRTFCTCAGMTERGGTSGTPFHLVNRSTWGARVPNGTTPFPHPPATYVVIIHTASVACDDEASCSAEVREIQKMHMDVVHFGDIAYNFLVGGDGQTYEGRGWDLIGAFARGFNNKSLGIAFIGKALLISNFGKEVLFYDIVARC